MYIYQRDSSGCNDGDCTCKLGYSGNDCNSCEEGFFIASVEDGENNCTGEYSLTIVKYLYSIDKNS